MIHKVDEATHHRASLPFPLPGLETCLTFSVSLTAIHTMRQGTASSNWVSER